MSTLKLARSGLVLVWLVFLSLTSKAQLNAQFSATPVSGCAPLLVNFTDLSSGNPTQWRWDLGNGTISFLKNPSATYFIAGQYTVKLVIQKPGGIDSIVKTQYITIFPQPVVNFNSSTQAGCFPLPVQFNDLSTTNSGTITQWQWDFGDGTFDNTQHPNHIYSAAGNYNVSLVVTNSHGCFKSLTNPQYIQISNGTTADFTNTIPNSCSPPVNINFQNLSSGTGFLSYAWNFGDGGTSTQVNPSHNYSMQGSYTVQLIVSNSTGCRDTIIKPNSVTIGAVQSTFNSPDSVCVGTAVTFMNTSVPAPASSSWNFGDGSFSSVISPVKTYTVAGNYQVKLVNSFGACSDSVTRNIIVSPLPIVSFSTNDTLNCQSPFTVHFTNTSTGANTYFWQFGDGTTSTLQNPVHTYTTAGSFTVRLICTNIYGCSTSLPKPQYIKIQLPQASINGLPEEGCAPFSWTFSSTVNSAEPVTGYQWNFGDGSNSLLPNPTHVFSAGTYNISLIITTANGCTDTVTATNGIKVGVKPTPNFIATPRNVCAYVAVSFSDLSTGNVDQWLWDFGDGGTSVGQNPSHIYTDTGYFSVQLIVWNNGCPDTLKIDNYIHISPPIASFTVSSLCIDPLRRIFTDHSVGADLWSWNFGDGNTSILQNPVHVYVATGTYIVTLVVTNLASGCTHTATKTVRLINENIAFIASDTILCRNTIVTFMETGSNPLNIGLYQWNFGDGATGTGHTATHNYTISGVYDVSLIMVDYNGCRDTLIKQQYIRVNGPTAGFSVPSAATCIINNINFTDSSTSDGISPITQWIWNYGDGVIDTLSSGPFQHQYTSQGIYSVSLTVTDINGCSDSLIKISLLTISRPVAGFNGDTLSCPGGTIHFYNTSVGNGLIYHWDFGDGGISINTNPTHIYAANGVYTIKLFVVDPYGCTDSMIKVNYISIYTPTAGFTVSDTAGTCPPLIVSFTNTSQNYTSFSWDFGDGSSSTNFSPSHFYNIPGTYNAVLTVIGTGGCISTRQQTITVRGPYGTFTYDPLTGCQPLLINFISTTQDRVSFIWDFDDGTTIPTNDSIISHTYVIPGRYLPKMILVDIAGCTVAITGPDSIIVHGVSAGFNFNPPNSCTPSNVQFTNTATSSDVITTYAWDFDDGSTSTLPDPSHLYVAPGLYYPSLKVITEFGCFDSIKGTIPIRIVALPEGQITRSLDGCVPLTMNFAGSLAIPDTSVVTWFWDFGNGATSTSITPPNQVYNVAGTYPVTLIVTNSSGCKDTILNSVQAFALPNISAGRDTTICQGIGRSLRATGGISYTWSPSAGLSCITCDNPIATPSAITTYVVEGLSAQGCINTDSLIVNVKFPFNINKSAGDTLCKGSSINLFASGAYTYSWSPSTGLNSTSTATPIASPVVSTLYQVIGTDNLNCFKDTAYVPVTVFDLPTVEAGTDETINVGETIDLIPVISNDVISVIWNPTGSIFRSDYPSVTVRPRQTTTFTVEVTNAGGCVSSDNRTIYVICNGANVFIPNTFSPNGDGANDIFYPRGRGLFSIKSARVFNRWGEVVYEKSNFKPNDSSAGWNGIYKGQPLNTDVYVYVIDIMCDNNTVLTYKGNIALIK
ncbi:MAG: PKD domain-containing protein [Ferruginibacter sp.]